MAYQQILDTDIQAGSPVDAVLLVKVKENDAAFNSSIGSINSSISSINSSISNLQTQITNNNTAIDGRVVTLESKMSSVDLISESTKTASYTLALVDRNTLIAFNHATVAGVFTIPTNATVAFPIGTQISFVQTGAAQLSIAAASGVTIATEVGLKLNAVNAMASIIKVGTDSWRLTGSLKA